MAKRYRLGVDVGGTHTDLVLLDTLRRRARVEKVSTTPANPALRRARWHRALSSTRGRSAGEIEFFAHGTTITTNALLEMRGAKVGLLITAGYRAVQEMQKQARDGNPFDYFYPKPRADRAAEPARARFPSRIDYAGAELDAARRGRGARSRRGAEGARRRSRSPSAILFSYMNPAHEKRTARAHRARSARGAMCRCRREVLPRIREWPRLSTTLLNAYLAPVLVRYIARPRPTGSTSVGVEHAAALPDAVERRRHAVRAPRSPASKTVHTLLSGPAAGAQASAYLGRRRGARRPRHPRHGRHQRRHRLHRGRRAAGGDRRHGRAPRSSTCRRST